MKKGHAILLIIIALSTLLVVMPKRMIQNVFDEMYYAHEKTTLIPFTQTHYKNTHINHKAEDTFRYPDDERFFENYLIGSFTNDNELIQIQGYMREKILKFSCKVGFDGYEESHAMTGTALWLEYRYDIKQRTLFIDPLSIASFDLTVSHNTFSVNDTNVVREFLESKGLAEVDIEKWNNYFLYEKVLSDWFQANTGKTHYSMENLGNLEIINNQFPDK